MKKDELWNALKVGSVLWCGNCLYGHIRITFPEQKTHCQDSKCNALDIDVGKKPSNWTYNPDKDQWEEWEYG